MPENGQAPPSSNRGVQNTSRSTLRACVDWVQVTLTNVYDLQKIYAILHMDESQFEDFPTGFYGYKSQKRCGHISILYDGGAGMGIHIQFSGQGCREYETYGKRSWRELFMELLSLSANFTRIDIAIDDIAYEGQKPYFTLNKLYRKTLDGCVRSRFKRGKYVQSLLLEDGSNLGETLYFGREQSDIQIRFYEKDFERVEAGKELEENLVAWNRTEVQCRRDRAQALAIHIVIKDDVCVVTSGVLRNYIGFLVKSADVNKSRWNLCKWWDDFLGDVEKLKLTWIAPDRTVEKAMEWIDKQVSPTLAMIFTATDGNLDLIYEYISNGMDRLTKEQLALAKDYSDQLEEEKKLKEYDRKTEWNRYLFKTGAHRSLENKKEIDALSKASE